MRRTIHSTITLMIMALVVAAAQSTALLPPFDQVEFEPAKREKALAATQEYRIEALNKDSSLSPEARQQQINLINGEANKNAEALLNKDQRLKLGDLGREANYKPPPFAAQLEMNEQQQAKFKETMLWRAREAAALNQDAALSAEQRQQRLLKINEGVMDRFAGFLTPEQMTKLNTLLKEMQQKQSGQKPQ